MRAHLQGLPVRGNSACATGWTPNATFKGASALERVLPTARRPPLGIGLGEIVQHLLALLTLHVDHAVTLHHHDESLLPTLARQTLLRHDLEAVAGGAEVERVVAMLACRILLRRFLRRPLSPRLGV